MASKKFSANNIFVILGFVLVCLVLAVALWFVLNRSQEAQAPTVEEEQSEVQEAEPSTSTPTQVDSTEEPVSEDPGTTTE